MHRSSTFTTLAAALALGLLAAQQANAERPTKPNIIFILADDLGYGGLGSYGQKLILTPELDKMAAEGIRFTDFYSANTVCVPSRVGMLLGMHPGQAPVRDNLRPHLPDFDGYLNDMPKELWPPKLTTFGRMMKDAGYKTAQFGKLEAGLPMEAGKMTEHGWDHWFGFTGTGAAFQFYPLELWKNDVRIEFPENRPEEVRRTGILGDQGTYSQQLFTEGILEFIRESKDEPFFLYFPTQIPHGRSHQDGDQIQLPDIGQYADRDWTHLEKLYAACMTVLDTDVGRIIRQLQDLGIDENTIIIFSSDNGDENSYYGYTKRFKAAGPLEGKKRFLYEGGIRVPTIVRWPGTIKPGETTDLIAAGWDFMATFADLAGVEPPAHHTGISIMPTLLGQPDQQEKREFLYWEYHQGKQQAVRIGPWKGVRFGGTKEPIELYNLDDDIGENHNIAGQHPEIVKRMEEIMVEAREGSEFNRFWPLPERRLENNRNEDYIFNSLEQGIR